MSKYGYFFKKKKNPTKSGDFGTFFSEEKSFASVALGFLCCCQVAKFGKKNPKNTH